jgi:hypothetical protein
MRIALRTASPRALAVLAHTWLASTWLGSTIAQAHPEHALEVVPTENPLHLLLQPEHALVSGTGLAALIAVTFVVRVRIAAVRRQQRLQPVRVRR